MISTNLANWLILVRPTLPITSLSSPIAPQQQEASDDDDDDEDDDDEIADPMVELKEKCAVRVLPWLFTHTFSTWFAVLLFS
jgi:hypothetical protein